MKEKVENNTAQAEEDKGTRLNKYLASAGISSRRKADELIANGEVQVNAEVVTQMGFRVYKKDKVTYNGKTVRRKRFTYLLLNKPKDCITTTEVGIKIIKRIDKRTGNEIEIRVATIMELVKNATKQRVFPVGKLDRHTTGLILITNDGDLANKLAHPESFVEKIYKVELEKSLSEEDLTNLKAGIKVEEEILKFDDIQYTTDRNGRLLKNVLGIKLCTGKNNAIRRIFNNMENKIVKLDRTGYCGLTKKNLSKGDWRMLEKEEVIQLKHLGDKGFKNINTEEKIDEEE